MSQTEKPKDQHTSKTHHTASFLETRGASVPTLVPPRVIIPHVARKARPFGSVNRREGSWSLTLVPLPIGQNGVKIILVGVITRGGMRSSSEAFIYLAMSRLMVARLARD